MESQRDALHKHIAENIISHVVIDAYAEEREATKKELLENSIKLESCDANKAQNGDLSQKMCLAKAYLSDKLCKEAEKHLKEILEISKYYEGIEGPLEYVGELQYNGECIDIKSDL